MLNNQLAVALLKFINSQLDERMEYAKTHTSDERAINIAGFCSELKKAISLEKAKMIGKL